MGRKFEEWTPHCRHEHHSLLNEIWKINALNSVKTIKPKSKGILELHNIPIKIDHSEKLLIIPSPSVD